MIPSRVGEAWRAYLQKDELSWCVPESIDADYFPRHTRSEWIGKMLWYTGLKPSPGVRVLEAGCGTAMFGLSLAVLGFAVDAFDYNEEALVFARKLEAKAVHANPELQFRLLLGNILSIDAESGMYALVFNQAVLEYFVDDWERERALQEMVRVAQSGGWVAVISQNLSHPLRGFWRRTGYPGYTDGPPMHTCSGRTLKQAFEHAGLTNVITDGIYPWHFLFLWPKWYKGWRLAEKLVYFSRRSLDYIPLPRAVRQVIAPQIIAVGQKP